MRDAWQRTSAVMALIANVNRDPKRGRPFRPADFDPFAAHDQPIRVGVEILKDVFVDKFVDLRRLRA